MNNSLVKICDNFFPLYVQKEIISYVLSPDLKWSFIENVSYNNEMSKILKKNAHKDYIKDTSAFVCFFSDTDFENKLKTQIISILQNKFSWTENYISRAVFVYFPPDPAYPNNCYLPMHVDEYYKPVKNFLYYITDNDAETILYDRIHTLGNLPELFEPSVFQKIEAKQGRALMFDGRIYHSGNVSRTKPRITLNFVLEQSQD